MLNWLSKLISSGEKEKTQTNAAAVADMAADPGPLSQGPTTAAGPAQTSPVSRMILLDRNGQIIGYEFVSRSGTLGVRVADPRNQKINDQLLVRTILGMGADRIAQFRQIWLTVGEGVLGGGLLDGLPAKATMVLVRLTGHAPVADEVLQQVQALRAKGFRFGLAGYSDNEGHHCWLPLIDVVALDIGTFAPDELSVALEGLHARRADLKVLARRIDSYEEYEYCVEKGFDLFSGRFLTHRESWPPQPPLSPDRVRLCNLLNQLRGGADLTDIAEGLKLSPELSYRFLRYINSVGMGTSSHIGSLEQGVLYLGREKLYRWLTLLLFSSAGGQPTDAALLEQALVRGRMMEMMSAEKLSRVQSEELFVVGVFSLLDVLLRLPLDIALRPLQLPTAVSQALVGGSGLYASYLRLAKVSEECEGDPGQTGGAISRDPLTVAALATEVGLSVEQVNQQHLLAVAWAHQLQNAQAPA